jgi:hypothetical protein
MSHLIHTELGLQVRAGSALAAIADGELPVGPPEVVAVCAWCAPEGGAVFLEAVGKDPMAVSPECAPAPRQVLSHGICPQCAQRMRAEYRETMARGVSR